ncbi:MAG: hypothetical protein JW915_09480 [Chitinispirillaceae bacterium]|nr:hypothetical protein [Chitinispirillaceae bacterium]
MEQCEQQKLSLFPEATFDQLIALKNISERLTVRSSSRLVRGWNISINRVTGRRTLTIPMFLINAPVPVKMALIAWALLPIDKKRSRSKEEQQRRRHIEEYIYSHLSERGLLKPSISRIDREKLSHKTAGNKFDLKEIYTRINASYFDNKIKAYLRWGTPGSTTSYQTVRRSKDGSCWNLITIADIYNHPRIPLFAIESVMFHEMLHIAIPPYRKNGKNVIHGKEFKAAEKLFPHFEQWRAWENNDLKLILKEMRRRKKNLFF